MQRLYRPRAKSGSGGSAHTAMGEREATRDAGRRMQGRWAQDHRKGRIARPRCLGSVGGSVIAKLRLIEAHAMRTTAHACAICGTAGEWRRFASQIADRSTQAPASPFQEGGAKRKQPSRATVAREQARLRGNGHTGNGLLTLESPMCLWGAWRGAATARQTPPSHSSLACFNLKAQHGRGWLQPGRLLGRGKHLLPTIRSDCASASA